MRKRVPGTELLITFEASARHQSFTRAAEELSLTQSAVCRQIAALEAFLGVNLFLRVKKRVKLSEAGLIYAKQVRETLKRMEQDTLSLMARRGTGGVVTLALLPTFASHWLIPRLPNFHADHPEITIDIMAHSDPFIFGGTPFDAAIHSTPSVWPGTNAEMLFRDQIIPVCAPKLIDKVGTVAPEDLQNLPLLHQSTRPNDWQNWFTSVGLQNANPMGGPRYELLSMLVEAAKAGLGVILSPRFFVLDELASGRLICPCAPTLGDRRNYHLIQPDEREESTPFRLFKTWLLRQTAEFQKQVEKQQNVTSSLPAG